MITSIIVLIFCVIAGLLVHYSPRAAQMDRQLWWFIVGMIVLFAATALFSLAYQS